MSINLEKVSKLTGFVDKLIQIKDMETVLDEAVVVDMIEQATESILKIKVATTMIGGRLMMSIILGSQRIHGCII